MLLDGLQSDLNSSYPMEEAAATTVGYMSCAAASLCHEWKGFLQLWKKLPLGLILVLL